MSAGRVFASAPDLGKGMAAARLIFGLVDHVPPIDSMANEKTKARQDANGSFGYDRVEFRYPTRPNVQVLNGVSVNIQPGETIALVGPSGCGNYFDQK